MRDAGRVRYLGWAVPEAVYIDFEIIGSAPPNLNLSGIGDVLCYHTARSDWQLADRMGRSEARWPYDQRLVDDAAIAMASVVDALDEIRAARGGIRAPVASPLGRDDVPRLRLNPRHIEGVTTSCSTTERSPAATIHGPVGLGTSPGRSCR